MATKLISIRIDEIVLQNLDDRARHAGKTRTDVFNEAFDMYLAASSKVINSAPISDDKEELTTIIQAIAALQKTTNEARDAALEARIAAQETHDRIGEMEAVVTRKGAANV